MKVAFEKILSFDTKAIIIPTERATEEQTSTEQI